MADFMYGAPALTAQGPGLWNFGFFSVTNGLPESVISGKETPWVRNFIDLISYRPGAVSAQAVEIYAQALRDPARLRASFEYFRAFPTDIADVDRYRQQGQHCPLSVLVSQLGPSEPSVRAVVVDLLDRWEDRIADGIRRMQGQGKIAPRLNAERTAAALLAGIQGGVLVMLATGRMTHLEAALDQAIERLRDSTRQQPPATVSR